MEEGTSRKQILCRTMAVFIVLAGVTLLSPDYGFAARIKEMGYMSGVRPNQLLGYGLVVGLNGSGDKANTLFTTQSLSNMLERMGVTVDPKATKVRNVAAVIVTADVPPFAKVGNRIDATVSSIGDAKSLEGGVLLLTPLRGGDGEIYAIAQGALVTGAFAVTGEAAKVQKNHPTVGRIGNGATIEKEINYEDFTTETVVISLKTPDFTNAGRVADRINTAFPGSAQAKDGGTITVAMPEKFRTNRVKFLSMIENLDVKPDFISRIVVDEKTGTIVIGENVRIATVAISHGNISIQIKEEPRVSQPMPFSQGQTVVTSDTQIRVEEERGRWFLMEGDISIRELVKALNATGVSTRDVIVILQTIKAAGALHAELDVI
jgi:flagellar P-ring protein precursor FlgI